jgi:hypothetical protein
MGRSTWLRLVMSDDERAAVGKAGSWPMFPDETLEPLKEVGHDRESVKGSAAKSPVILLTPPDATIMLGAVRGHA